MGNIENSSLPQSMLIDILYRNNFGTPILANSIAPKTNRSTPIINKYEFSGKCKDAPRIPCSMAKGSINPEYSTLILRVMQMCHRNRKKKSDYALRRCAPIYFQCGAAICLTGPANVQVPAM